MGSAAAIASAAGISSGQSSSQRTRVFVASSAPDGILAYDWDPATAELSPAGIASKTPKVDWVTFARGHEFLYSASEVDQFNGKPTGEVASYRVREGKLELLSARNSAGIGTCQVAADHTGRMLLSADYGGGSAASFRIMTAN